LINKQRRDQLHATNDDLLVISCSSTCFGHLYTHHQEIGLRFTAYGFLSCFSCCDAGESGSKMGALHSAVRYPDDGRKDAWNMLRNNWLPINHHLLHLVGLAFIYFNFVNYFHCGSWFGM